MAVGTVILDAPAIRYSKLEDPDEERQWDTAPNRSKSSAWLSVRNETRKFPSTPTHLPTASALSAVKRGA